MTTTIAKIKDDVYRRYTKSRNLDNPQVREWALTLQDWIGLAFPVRGEYRENDTGRDLVILDVSGRGMNIRDLTLEKDLVDLMVIA